MHADVDATHVCPVAKLKSVQAIAVKKDKTAVKSATTIMLYKTE
jgi:hypothetical protein